MNYKLNMLLEYVKEDGRICPMPFYWNKLWEMLPCRKQISSGGWEPPSKPLIFGAWWTSDGYLKAKRLQEHINYAEENGVLDKIDLYLRDLTPEQWVYDNGTKEWREKFDEIKKEFKIGIPRFVSDEINRRVNEELERVKAVVEENNRKALVEATKRVEVFLSNPMLGSPVESLLAPHKDLILKFFEIAERKYSRIDEYGDEDKEALNAELVIAVNKLGFKSPAVMLDSNSVRSELRRIFLEYHSLQSSCKTKKMNIDDLSGIDFEVHIANVLKNNGFNDVRGTPVTGDQGADLIVNEGGRLIIIQAKRYEGAVSNKAVQEVIGAKRFYGANEGWVITNSRFTDSAKALAQSDKIKLVDGHDLKNIDDVIRKWRLENNLPLKN